MLYLQKILIFIFVMYLIYSIFILVIMEVKLTIYYS